MLIDLKSWLNWNQGIIKTSPLPSTTSNIQQNNHVPVNTTSGHLLEECGKCHASCRIDINTFGFLKNAHGLESFAIISSKHVALTFSEYIKNPSSHRVRGFLVRE